MFMASSLQYLINEILRSATLLLWQKIHNSETIRTEKAVNIDFSALIA
jgi:hypothetical protein